MKSYINEHNETVNELYNAEEGSPADPFTLLNEFFGLGEETDSNSETGLEEHLGKRKAPEPPSIGVPGRVVRDERPGKYLDPKTGAYFNNIEEFKKLRVLHELAELEKLKQVKVALDKLFVAKRKKVSLQIFDKKVPG